MVRQFERVLIWSRRTVQAAALASKVEFSLPVSACVVATAAEATAAAQLVITTTSARHPVLTEDHLHEELHITAVGSDAAGKRELADGLLHAIDLYVPDDLHQCRMYGELQSGAEKNIARIATIGDIIAKVARGRERETEITVADLTGLGVQDTAIALEAYERLKGYSV
jgi:ornithine cyclodeaminase